MATITVNRFKTIDITQSAADTYTQVELDTGLEPADGYGWLLKNVDFGWITDFKAIAADCRMGFQITRNTKASEQFFNANDMILKRTKVFALVTSGGVMIDEVESIDLTSGTIVVEPTIYAAICTTGTGLACRGILRVNYELVKISELEIMRALVQGGL